MGCTPTKQQAREGAPQQQYGRDERNNNGEQNNNHLKVGSNSKIEGNSVQMVSHPNRLTEHEYHFINPESTKKDKR